MNWSFRPKSKSNINFNSNFKLKSKFIYKTN